MRLRIFAIIIITCLGLGIQAQQEVQYNPEKAVITFEHPVLDMGTIQEGDKINMQFDFINSGKEALEIELVTACKCTSLSWPEENVEPNGKASIFVTFDSTGYEGEVLKVVDVISNTDPIVVEARFKVFVEKVD